jgi:hypothetical protein
MTDRKAKNHTKNTHEYYFTFMILKQYINNNSTKEHAISKVHIKLELK